MMGMRSADGTIWFLFVNKGVGIDALGAHVHHVWKGGSINETG